MKSFTAAVVTGMCLSYYLVATDKCTWYFTFSTVSDTCSAGTATDTSGPLLQQLLKDNFQPVSIKYDLIPDDASQIEVYSAAVTNNDTNYFIFVA